MWKDKEVYDFSQKQQFEVCPVCKANFPVGTPINCSRQDCTMKKTVELNKPKAYKF